MRLRLPPPLHHAGCVAAQYIDDPTIPDCELALGRHLPPPSLLPAARSQLLQEGTAGNTSNGSADGGVLPASITAQEAVAVGGADVRMGEAAGGAEPMQVDEAGSGAAAQPGGEGAPDAVPTPTPTLSTHDAARLASLHRGLFFLVAGERLCSFTLL